MTPPGHGDDGAVEHLRGVEAANGDPDAENSEVPPDSTGYPTPQGRTQHVVGASTGAGQDGRRWWVTRSLTALSG